MSGHDTESGSKKKDQQIDFEIYLFKICISNVLCPKQKLLNGIKSVFVKKKMLETF